MPSLRELRSLGVHKSGVFSVDQPVVSELSVVSRLPIQAVDAKKARPTAQQTHGQESEQAPRPALLKTEPTEALRTRSNLVGVRSHH
jgi:hypothetical protein